MKFLEGWYQKNSSHYENMYKGRRLLYVAIGDDISDFKEKYDVSELGLVRDKLSEIFKVDTVSVVKQYGNTYFYSNDGENLEEKNNKYLNEVYNREEG